MATTPTRPAAVPRAIVVGTLSGLELGTAGLRTLAGNEKETVLGGIVSRRVLADRGVAAEIAHSLREGVVHHLAVRVDGGQQIGALDAGQRGRGQALERGIFPDVTTPGQASQAGGQTRLPLGEGLRQLGVEVFVAA